MGYDLFMQIYQNTGCFQFVEDGSGLSMTRINKERAPIQIKITNHLGALGFKCFMKVIFGSVVENE